MSGRMLRVALLAPLAMAGLTAAGTGLTHGNGPGAPARCEAATFAHRVALVVEHGNGSVIRVCVGFDGSGITGEQVLQASGVQYATAGYGSLGQAVCQIDSEPRTYPSSCWTSSSPYWVLFHSHGNGPWTATSRGASSETFVDGDAEGFRYDQQGGAAAPPVSPAGACPAAAAAPSAASGTAHSAAAPSPAGAAPATAPPAASGAATSGATPSRTPGLIAGSPSGSPPAPGAAPLSPALLGASAAGGLLVGLLVLQLVRRARA